MITYSLTFQIVSQTPETISQSGDPQSHNIEI